MVLSYHDYKKKYGQEIDKGIKNLVDTLNKNGNLTMASCEGGEGHTTTYPWVAIHPSKRINKLREQIKGFNQTDNMKWELKKEARWNPNSHSHPTIEMYYLRPLSNKMDDTDRKEKIQELAKYLYSRQLQKHRANKRLVKV